MDQIVTDPSLVEVSEADILSFLSRQPVHGAREEGAPSRGGRESEDDYIMKHVTLQPNRRGVCCFLLKSCRKLVKVAFLGGLSTAAVAAGVYAVAAASREVQAFKVAKLGMEVAITEIEVVRSDMKEKVKQLEQLQQSAAATEKSFKAEKAELMARVVKAEEGLYRAREALQQKALEYQAATLEASNKRRKHRGESLRIPTGEERPEGTGSRSIKKRDSGSQTEIKRDQPS